VVALLARKRHPYFNFHQMARKKNIQSKQQFDSGLVLEKSGDIPGALKFYGKSVTTDPSNSHAWNRQMILHRKSGSKEEEVKLIKTAITEYQNAAKLKHQEWMNENKEKADSTRELAEVLGLLEPSGLPKNVDAIVEKWQTRLYLLEYRIKNSRKKKTPAKKKAGVESKKVKPKTDKSIAKSVSKNVSTKAAKNNMPNKNQPNDQRTKDD